MFLLIVSCEEYVGGYLDYSESKIFAKSDDISTLQAILHEKYWECIRNEYVVEINGTERDWDWEETFDESEFYNEEDYDEDENYIGSEEYLLYGWPDEPEECENELSCTTIDGDMSTTVHLCIVSEDDIKEVK